MNDVGLMEKCDTIVHNLKVYALIHHSIGIDMESRMVEGKLMRVVI